LDAATFKRVRVDRKTKVDERYIRKVGRQRDLSVRIPSAAFMISRLKRIGISLEQPHDQHLGDILEDALFGEKSPMTTGLGAIFDDKILTEISLKGFFDGSYVVKGTKSTKKTDVVNGLILDYSNKKNSPRSGYSADLMNSFEKFISNIESTRSPNSISEIGTLFIKNIVDSNESKSMIASISKRTAETLKKRSGQMKSSIEFLCFGILISYTRSRRER